MQWTVLPRDALFSTSLLQSVTDSRTLRHSSALLSDLFHATLPVDCHSSLSGVPWQLPCGDAAAEFPVYLGLL